MPRNSVTNDQLASMIKQGFDHVSDDISVMKTDIAGMKSDITSLTQGQGEVLSRLDNVAYRFEAVDLEKRVDRLERKTGIRK